VPGLSHIVAIAGGVFTGFALASDGTEWVWGFEDSGGTGNGHSSDDQTDPFVLLHHVQGLGQTVDSRTGAAVLPGGVVKAWGSNASGQIGLGLPTHELRPVSVAGIRHATQVRFSARDGYALLSDGTVRAWGSDAAAGYGDGDPALLTVPGTVQVALPRAALAIAAGGDSAFALLTNHTVVSWGRNTRLELGTPLPLQQVFPALVPLPDGVTAIAAGWETGLALTSH
jgi:alpha-tubulin suppressor-like RCC1 family protein